MQADRGLGQVQRVGRSGEGAEVDDGDHRGGDQDEDRNSRKIPCRTGHRRINLERETRLFAGEIKRKYDRLRTLN